MLYIHNTILAHDWWEENLFQGRFNDVISTLRRVFHFVVGVIRMLHRGPTITEYM